MTLKLVLILTAHRELILPIFHINQNYHSLLYLLLTEYRQVLPQKLTLIVGHDFSFPENVKPLVLIDGVLHTAFRALHPCCYLRMIILFYYLRSAPTDTDKHLTVTTTISQEGFFYKKRG